jgi:hypothetical protein
MNLRIASRVDSARPALRRLRDAQLRRCLSEVQGFTQQPENIADAAVPSLSPIMPKRHGCPNFTVMGGLKQMQDYGGRW